VPEQHAPAGQYVPERNFAAVPGVPAWSDVNPRVGAAYDLFGDGRTALKMAIGRYVGKTATTVTGANNPIQTSVIQVNRTWNDTNRNYSPDCDLRNPAANGECGALEDQNFGQNNPRATRYADDVLRGFGVRDSSWDLTTEVQHQFGPGMSLTGGYYRSWQTNFRLTDNLDVTPEDFSPFCITAPGDPGLPGGGGYQICGLYDISPAKFGRVSNLVSQASHYGKQTRASDFFGLTFTTRIGSGIQFGGGVDTGRSVDDLCFVVDSPGMVYSATGTLGTFAGPFTATTIDGRPFCRTVTPFSAQTQVKFFGSYPLPGGFMASGTFQNVAGPSYQANYQATNAEIAPSLGRNLAACGTRVVCTATAVVPLIAPQTQFEDRRTQLDVRLSRVFRLGATVRAQANVDVYNVFNASSILGLNNTYGRQWRVPVTSIATGAGVLNGRLLQFSGRVSF
jgi:hypothetical protein